MSRSIQSPLFILLFLSTVALAQQPTEQWRPVYHFTPEKNWMNDPNGLIYYNGYYQLYYQYNPLENHWGHMSWGHARSKDLAHWERLPVAIPEDSVWIFSGSAVIDAANTSGLFTKGKGGPVAIYTADYHGKRENQHIGWSEDGGMTYKKYAGNPVLDLNKKDFRDPSVFWHEPTKRWIMTVVVPDAHAVQFYRSDDLKQWKLLSEFSGQGDRDMIWECPSLIEVYAGEKIHSKWVLFVSSQGPHKGYSGVQYFIGEFDGTVFKNENDPAKPLFADYGRDFYAAAPYLNKPGLRGPFVGWMISQQYGGDQPTYPWKGAMAIPRNLAVANVPDGYRLISKPAPEVYKAFKPGKSYQSTKPGTLALQTPVNGAYYLDLKFAGSWTLELFRQQDGKSVVVSYDHAKHELTFDRTAFTGIVNPSFATKDVIDIQDQAGQEIPLEIWVDRSSVEIFANYGMTCLTNLVFAQGELGAPQLVTQGGTVKCTVHEYR